MTMWHHHHCCNLHEKHYNVICCFYYHCYSTWRWWQWGWALIVENGKPMKAHIFDGDGVCNWQFFCQIVFVVAHQHKNTLRISYLKMPKKYKDAMCWGMVVHLNSSSLVGCWAFALLQNCTHIGGSHY
jgi:hypothetical protein